MHKYVCQSCGANLDLGEKCDCTEKRKEAENLRKQLFVQEKDGQFALKELIACT